MGHIFLMRHGQTVANRDRLIQGPRIDAELSDLGVRQSVSLGQALAVHPLGALYSSPLLRARQTAQAVASAQQTSQQGLALQVVPELYEMDFGHFTGRDYTEVAPAMEQVLDAWRLGYVSEPFPGGESPVVAQHRVRPFLGRLVDQAESQDVAVVAHGRINRILLASLTGAGLTRLEEFAQSNASITQLEVKAGKAVVLRLNDTGHLDLASDAFS